MAAERFLLLYLAPRPGLETPPPPPAGETIADLLDDRSIYGRQWVRDWEVVHSQAEADRRSAEMPAVVVLPLELDASETTA